MQAARARPHPMVIRSLAIDGGVAAGAWVIALLLVLVVVIVPVAIYNRLVTLRNRCRESWSNVDTELKRRYDLIPNLVATVQGYARHERDVLESVVAARAKAMATHDGAGERERDERPLVAALGRLLAVVERYPDLKASRNFLALQEELAITEDRIQAARRFYNGNVRDYRNKCESFPSNLVAQMGGFQPEEFFSVHPSVREVPDVEFSNLAS